MVMISRASGKHVGRSRLTKIRGHEPYTVLGVESLVSRPNLAGVSHGAEVKTPSLETSLSAWLRMASSSASR
jgi:hypothetical protein